MSKTSIGIRIPSNLHKRLEKYITSTHSTKTKVIVSALAQYLGSAEEVPLSQRVAALEAQVNEVKVQLRNLSRR